MKSKKQEDWEWIAKYWIPLVCSNCGKIHGYSSGGVNAKVDVEHCGCIKPVRKIIAELEKRVSKLEKGK